MSLFVRALQFLTQLCQFSFQLASPLANLVRFLLGTFAKLDFLDQRFGQSIDSRQEVRLCCLQFLGSRLQLGLFGARGLLLRLELSL